MYTAKKTHRAPVGCRGRRGGSSVGFSLVEVLIAIGILGVGLSFSAALFPAAIQEGAYASSNVLGNIMSENALAVARAKLRHPTLYSSSNCSLYLGTTWDPNMVQCFMRPNDANNDYSCFLQPLTSLYNAMPGSTGTTASWPLLTNSDVCYPSTDPVTSLNNTDPNRFRIGSLVFIKRVTPLQNDYLLAAVAYRRTDPNFSVFSYWGAPLDGNSTGGKALYAASDTSISADPNNCNLLSIGGGWRPNYYTFLLIDRYTGEHANMTQLLPPVGTNGIVGPTILDRRISMYFGPVGPFWILQGTPGGIAASYAAVTARATSPYPPQFPGAYLPTSPVIGVSTVRAALRD